MPWPPAIRAMPATRARGRERTADRLGGGGLGRARRRARPGRRRLPGLAPDDHPGPPVTGRPAADGDARSARSAPERAGGDVGRRPRGRTRRGPATHRGDGDEVPVAAPEHAAANALRRRDGNGEVGAHHPLDAARRRGGGHAVAVAPGVVGEAPRRPTITHDLAREIAGGLDRADVEGPNPTRPSEGSSHPAMLRLRARPPLVAPIAGPPNGRRTAARPRLRETPVPGTGRVRDGRAHGSTATSRPLARVVMSRAPVALVDRARRVVVDEADARRDRLTSEPRPASDPPSRLGAVLGIGARTAPAGRARDLGRRLPTTPQGVDAMAGEPASPSATRAFGNDVGAACREARALGTSSGIGVLSPGFVPNVSASGQGFGAPCRRVATRPVPWPETRRRPRPSALMSGPARRAGFRWRRRS